MLRDSCRNLVTEGAWRARSCAGAFLFEPQYEHILWRIHSDKPSIKIPLGTYSLYAMVHLSALFHYASAYTIGDLFDGCRSPIISASVSEITSFIAYFLRR